MNHRFQMNPETSTTHNTHNSMCYGKSCFLLPAISNFQPVPISPLFLLSFFSVNCVSDSISSSSQIPNAHHSKHVNFFFFLFSSLSNGWLVCVHVYRFSTLFQSSLCVTLSRYVDWLGHIYNWPIYDISLASIFVWDVFA